jgi:type II secretory pathway pseudopilin PulG
MWSRRERVRNRRHYRLKMVRNRVHLWSRDRRIRDLPLGNGQTNRYVSRRCVVPAVMRQRSGISLVELVAVLAIACLAMSAVVETVTRQQQFYRSTDNLRTARGGVRDAMEVLATDVRGMSESDTVRLSADSAIEFFATIGVSVICQVDGNELGLPEARPTGNSLSGFLADPDSGDLALVYTDSSGGNPGWRRYRISAFSGRSLSASCPTSSGFSIPSGVGAGISGFLVSIASPAPSNVKPGAAVRFIRRGRYSLYRAGDGYYYLGYRRCNALGPSVCGAIQPLSGPYRRYSSSRASTGILFEYFDAAGTRLGTGEPATDIARVDITARSETSPRAGFTGASATIADSATVSIAVRNRPRW